MISINISRLKANLSAEIKKLKQTGGVQIVQRDVPVAQLLPLTNEKNIQFFSRAQKTFKFLKSDLEVDFEPAEILLEERHRDRQ